MAKINMLFKPMQIGSVELMNRIAMAPMATHFADERGALTERQIDYYSERAKNGVGLIVTESCCVRDDGKRKKFRLSISNDEFIPKFKKLTRKVHKYGAKIAAQLHHGGRLCTPQDINEFPISASTVPCPLASGDVFIGNIPRTLGESEIKEIIECFGEGARRAYEAEFDLIQIHAAHGYLINNFLSPESNKRNDKYGGNLANRVRFLSEIINCVRMKTGRNIPIMVRLNGAEFIPGGYGLKEAKLIAKRLEKKGIDEIDITAGNHGSVEWSIQPGEFEQGCLTFMSEEIKKVVELPVGTVGRIRDPYLADKILKDGRADLIYFGRALIADPEFASKARIGAISKIRKCINCMHCVSRLGQGLDINCSVNAQAGKERKHVVRPAKLSKRMLVIGGGPGGMEAARVLSLRGHRVVLYEKAKELGGSLNLASIPPFREEIRSFRSYLENELRSLKVEIILNQEYKAGDARNNNEFDSIIFATGSEPLERITGIKLDSMMTADQLLFSSYIAGGRYIIVGAGAVGLQCADYLTMKRKDIEVVIIEKEATVGRDIGNIEKKMILTRLLSKGVRIWINSRISRLQENRVVISKGDEKVDYSFDLMINAIGRTSCDRPFSLIESGNIKKYKIGDCVQPRKIVDAIHEAYKLASKL